MQIAHIKYIKTNKNEVLMFYHKSNSIYYKVQNDGLWSQSILLSDNVSSTFSISQTENEVYILYCTIDGNIILSKSSTLSVWDKKTLFSNKKELLHTKFFMIPIKTSFHIIYHLPIENSNMHSLVYTSFENGKWSEIRKIDSFLPIPQTIFFTGRITKNHILLYYKTTKNVIIAREMLLSPYTLGTAVPVIQTSFPCADISVLNDNEKIHMLYIIKGLFRSQVVYQYKHSSSISTPRVLWEDSNCDNCLIFQENGSLILMWIANSKPYQCISDNNGNFFKSVERYKKPFPKRCIKSEFSIWDPKKETFNASEYYGDLQKEYEPALFISSPILSEKPVSTIIQKKTASFLPDNFLRPASDFSSFSEKDQQKQQIEEMSTLLLKRSTELSDINSKWRTHVLNLESENQKMKTSLELSVSENIHLKKIIASLDEKVYELQQHSEKK